MTAAIDRSQCSKLWLKRGEPLREIPDPETYRALLEAQSELQRYDLTYGKNRPLRELPNRTRQSKLRV